jgi:class 3 adenylate cyclase/putative methionine-R-sulfoxide reductase with GAF domain
MRRRSSAGGQPVKARHRKRSTPKRRNAPKATRNRGVSIGQGKVVARLSHERDEALLRETANSEILRLISKSPGDLELVFRTILEDATRLCEAKFGAIFRFDDNAFHFTAEVHTPPELADFQRRRGPFAPLKGGGLDRMMRTKQVVHSVDNAAEVVPTPAATLFGARSTVWVPMLNENELIGGIVIYRQEVQPFTDKQIALVQNFAAQAVIAIENTRLLNELRESLDRQTATSEVLSVISSSPGELEPVFRAMLANATKLCGASYGAMWIREEGGFRAAAMHGALPAAFLEQWRAGTAVRLDPENPASRAITTRQPVHVDDLCEDQAYLGRNPLVVAGVEVAGIRTMVALPMFKDNEPVGVISIYRREVKPFTKKQIDLVENFAAQAVIAIENTRLLNELRQSLEQQTATADVLRVISSSPSELEPVFSALLENATRICEAKFGTLFRLEGDDLHLAAQFGTPPELVEFQKRRGPFQPTPGHVLERALRTKQVCHSADITAEASPPATLGGARSLVSVPMLKDDVLIGAIAIYRQEVRPFTDRQIELLQNFASQAVIAIENTRLLNELRERTEQLEVRSREVVRLNQQLEQRVADQVGEIERMGRLRRFLPPQVADLIVTSGTEKQLESHRREITALFCDLRGFTGFSESSDPEDVMALLREYHAAIGEIIIKYSGTLERFAGDGVMVIFNDPVPVENPALQAVLMALDMRSAIGGMIEKWRDLGHDLGFGIGISHGFATLGTIGFEGRFDYAAIGTVSNVASRLCDEAKPGQILISPRVRLAVDKAVTIEAVGEFTLKGIRRPMTAYNVLAASPSKPN